jgi:hypothetical protein
MHGLEGRVAVVTGGTRDPFVMGLAKAAPAAEPGR